MASATLHQAKDHYEILGVGPNASTAEIRAAYRELVFIFHPDRLPVSHTRARLRAEEHLKNVNEAYEVLSDPKERERYDLNRSERPCAVDAEVPLRSSPSRTSQRTCAKGHASSQMALRTLARVVTWTLVLTCVLVISALALMVIVTMAFVLGLVFVIILIVGTISQP